MIPKPVTFAGVVTANAHRNNTNAAAFTSVACQNRPPPSSQTPTITRLVVLWDGGVDDPAKEALLQTQTDKIVMQVRTSIQSVVSPPPFHVLSGAWARRASPGSKPAPTGNFTFTLAGTVDFQLVLPFARHFIAPLLKGVLYPGDKWAYAQIRGVPTKSPAGVIYDSPDLLAEIQRDPVMGLLQLINAPHWQGKVANLADKDRSTVCIAFVDPSGSASAALAKASVSMFGARTPVLIMGGLARDPPVWAVPRARPHYGHVSQPPRLLVLLQVRRCPSRIGPRCSLQGPPRETRRVPVSLPLPSVQKARPPCTRPELPQEGSPGPPAFGVDWCGAAPSSIGPPFRPCSSCLGRCSCGSLSASPPLRPRCSACGPCRPRCNTCGPCSPPPRGYRAPLFAILTPTSAIHASHPLQAFQTCSPARSEGSKRR